MKVLMPIILVLSASLWIVYATVGLKVARLRAMSDAMQVEASFKSWASVKISEGKLDERDVQELFPEDDSLRFGGEDPGRSFREMIDHIAQLSAPPLWPGLLMGAVGLVGILRCLFGSRVKSESEASG
jgi:hypothetical protein